MKRAVKISTYSKARCSRSLDLPQEEKKSFYNCLRPVTWKWKEHFEMLRVLMERGDGKTGVLSKGPFTKVLISNFLSVDLVIVICYSF